MDAHRADAVGAGPTGKGARALGLGQGLFYLISGVWPLLHAASFLAVTGPKTDFWLAQTVGALLAVSGAVFMWAAWRGRLTAEVRFLAAAQAAVLASVDIVFVARGRILPVYLADAVVELAIVGGWLWVSRRGKPLRNQ